MGWFLMGIKAILKQQLHAFNVLRAVDGGQTKGIDLVVCFMSQNLSSTGNAQETIAQDSRMIYGYYNE